MDKKNLWLVLGGIGAALAVSTGAFGAHILERIISDDTFITWNKAVRYQMYHSIALILVSLLTSQSPSKTLDLAGWFFLIGILTFSGSLYLIVFTGLQLFGYITPIGGFAFVFGWLSIVYSGFKNRTPKT
jgi:uncharacterized membrane protein YgdD (TMEM256/DUF423 family)